MRRVSVHLQDDAPDPQAWLLFPRPFEDGVQSCTRVEADPVTKALEIRASNSHQSAWLVKPEAGSVPLIGYRFEAARAPVAGWVWEPQENRFTRASPELVAMAAELSRDCRNQAEAVRLLVGNAAERFGYGHPDERFNDGSESVPTICGTAKGSCVDINTYIMAAARSLGIDVQYFAGYWFHPDRTETLDMHCWLAFNCDGERVFWDLAHHLKWGVEELAPGLNPAGGRRVPMSCGRGLRFQTPHGEVEISHFSEPVWVLPDGETLKPELRIRIHESDQSIDGDRP